jgi:hypothetical protein
VVGEKIFVTVPLENLFNTALVLRKSALLWRFTTADQEQQQQDIIISNDKQPLPPNPPVLAEVVEAVTVERGVVTRVTYAITANCRGTLQILGLGRLLWQDFEERRGDIISRSTVGG